MKDTPEASRGLGTGPAQDFTALLSESWHQVALMVTYSPALASVSLTPGDAQHPHDPDDSGVNWESSIDFNLFQCDAHNRQQHNGQI